MSSEKKEEAEKELTIEQKVTQRTEALSDLNMEQMFVWRETLTDGMMPFKNFSAAYKENTKKGLGKDEQPDLGEQKDAIFTQEICKIQGIFDYQFDQSKKQSFELSSNVYATDLGCYVQLKKFDADKLTYECRVVKDKETKDAKEEKDDLKTIAQDKLTKLINVKVRKIDMTDIKTSGTTTTESPQILAQFKVQTSDKISKLIELTEMATGSSGEILVNGKSIEDKDVTFQSLNIKDGTAVAMPFSSGDGGSVKMWKRFKTIRFTDYYWMSYNYWESICFVPSRNITWKGFGIFSHRDNNNVEHYIQYYIDDDKTDLGLHKFENDSKDEEHKAFTVDLKKDLGVAPIKVNAGQKIHIMLKAKSEESRRTWYIYENDYDYRKRDDQPADFEIEYSSHDENGCTRVASGQFPFILYS